MKRVTVLWSVLLTLLLTGCGSSSFPLSVTREAVTFGESISEGGCEEDSFYGPRCYAVLNLKNNSDSPWSGKLSVNLLSTDGKSYAPYDGGCLDCKVTFEGTLNPGEDVRWWTSFKVESGKQFDKAELIDSNGTSVVTFDVNLLFQDN